MLLLALCLCAAPTLPSQSHLALRHIERLAVRARGRVQPDDTWLDGKAKVTVESMNDDEDRPNAVTVEALKYEFPKARVREEARAPMVSFEGGAQPLVNTARALRHMLGRLVVADAERDAMSSCTAETQPATLRWLGLLVAQINGADAATVTLVDPKVKCTATKAGTKLDVAFTAQAPRGSLLFTMQLKGTVTVERSIWVTQWKLDGKVHALSDSVDYAADGALSSSLSLSR